MGLLTRFAALVLATNVGVAFFFAHKGALSVGHSGELAFIYLPGCISLLFAGLRAPEFPLTPGPPPSREREARSGSGPWSQCIRKSERSLPANGRTKSGGIHRTPDAPRVRSATRIGRSLWSARASRRFRCEICPSRFCPR